MSVGVLSVFSVLTRFWGGVGQGFRGVIGSWVVPNIPRARRLPTSQATHHPQPLAITTHNHSPIAAAAKGKRAHDKEARLATVLAGREGRDQFGSRSGRKKAKTGGLSEREKQRRKSMPLAARVVQVGRGG